MQWTCETIKRRYPVCETKQNQYRGTLRTLLSTLSGSDFHSHFFLLLLLLHIFESFQLVLTVRGTLAFSCLFLFVCLFVFLHSSTWTLAETDNIGCSVTGMFCGTTQMSNTHWTNARKGRGPPSPPPPPPLFCLLMSISGWWSLSLPEPALRPRITTPLADWFSFGSRPSRLSSGGTLDFFFLFFNSVVVEIMSPPNQMSGLSSTEKDRATRREKKNKMEFCFQVSNLRITLKFRN